MISVGMQTKPQTPLADHLCQCARIWTEAQSARPTSLGYAVARDGKISQRLLAGQGDVTTATLEKFAAYLANPAHWPEGVVPEEAIEFAHRVGVTLPVQCASPGKAEGVTPAGDAAERAA